MQDTVSSTVSDLGTFVWASVPPLFHWSICLSLCQHQWSGLQCYHKWKHFIVYKCLFAGHSSVPAPPFPHIIVMTNDLSQVTQLGNGSQKPTPRLGLQVHGAYFPADLSPRARWDFYSETAGLEYTSEAKSQKFYFAILKKVHKAPKWKSCTNWMQITWSGVHWLTENVLQQLRQFHYISAPATEPRMEKEREGGYWANGILCVYVHVDLPSSLLVPSLKSPDHCRFHY